MKYLLVALVALAATATIEAQPESAYYGLSLGKLDFQENDFFGRPIVDDSVSSTRLIVGYQFLEHLGVEGGYGQTQTIRGSVSGAFNGVPFTLSSGYKFKSITVRLLGVLPFDNGVTLVGGIGYSDVKFKFNVTDGSATDSDSESVNQPGYYFGAQYDWDRVGVRLAYEKLDFEGGYFSDDIDASETSIAFFYRL
jgi:opacity protein-like surface antigen